MGIEETAETNAEIIEGLEPSDADTEPSEPLETENTDQGESEGEEDLIVSIGEEQTEENQEVNPPAPKWVKDLRKSHRELQRENR